MRCLDPPPLTARLDSGHLASRLRIADLANAVPNDDAPIDLVADHAGGSLRRTVNGRRVPGTAAKGFNTFAIESGGDVAAGVTSGIVAKDTQHDNRLVVVDLVLAGAPRDRTIAVRQAAGSLPLRELAGKPAACLGCEVGEIERADQDADADRDLARAPVVDGYKLTIAEAQHFPDLGQLRLRACNAIEALDDHDIEAAVDSTGDQILETGERMANFNKAVPCDGNQLEFILSRYNERAGVRDTMLQVAIFDPARDYIKTTRGSASMPAALLVRAHQGRTRRQRLLRHAVRFRQSLRQLPGSRPTRTRKGSCGERSNSRGRPAMARRLATARLTIIGSKTGMFILP